MSRLPKFLCRILTFLTTLCALKPAATVHADTVRPSPSAGAYTIAKCDFFATMAEKAAQFRDALIGFRGLMLPCCPRSTTHFEAY
jgi:hypothetical protein